MKSLQQVTESDMLVDEYEQYQNNDRTDVVVVSRSGSEEEAEPDPLADDRMSAILVASIFPFDAYTIALVSGGSELLCALGNRGFFTPSQLTNINRRRNDVANPSEGPRIRN